ncbi:MAG: hypothetical protein H0Z28_06340 [Archaeoglobus sp.]|nr:hypothetical protein [Archaeoglobus sp.]
MRKILVILIIFPAIIAINPASADDWVLKRITNNPIQQDWPMGITADGSKVLYISETDYNDNSNWDLEVFLADLTTGDTVRITYNIFAEPYASISEDGDKIAYLTEKYLRNAWGMYIWIIEVNVAELNDSWGSRSIASFERDACIHPVVQISDEIVAVGCDDAWYLLDASGNALGEFPRAYTYGKISGNQFVYAPNTKFYQSEGNLYPSRLKVLDLPDTAGVTYYAGEGEYIGRSFDVSSDGAMAFLLLSLESPKQSGIYLHEGSIIVQKHSGFILPPFDRVRVSGDGSKVFYQGWNDTISQPYSVIYEVLNGQLELVEDRMLLGDVDEDGSTIVAKRYVSGYSDIYVLIRESDQTQPIDQLSFNPGNFMPAFPAETTIVFQSSASSGDVQIPVNVRNANSIGSMNLELECPDVLEAIDVIPGSLTQNSLFEYNIRNGRISVGIVDTNGISGDGSLLYVKFRVIAGKSDAESSDGLYRSENPDSLRGRFKMESAPRIKFSDTHPLLIREAMLNHVNGSEIEVTLINGTFKLLKEGEANKGDVNGDGERTSVDALLALQMAVGKLKASITADTDGDGKNNLQGCP